MSAISDLYAKLSDIDAKLVARWQRAIVKRIKQFVKNIANVSPFIDKPKKSLFGARVSKDKRSVVVFGTSPNAGRMRAFNAPTDDWKTVSETYRIFGNRGWRTIHKIQSVRTFAGVPIQDVSYYGTSERPERFFGIKTGRVTLAYGKTRSGLALPVYARDSYADWVMQNHHVEIDNLILEVGREILFEHVNAGK